VQRDRFEKDNSNEKIAVSPEQPRHGLLDYRTLEEIGLHTALGTKCTKRDEGCIGDK
jgi:hypothetical protein